MVIQFSSSTGVKIITQQVQPSKILPKPSSVALSSSSSSPIMVVSSNGAIMTTKLVTQPTGQRPRRLTPYRTSPKIMNKLRSSIKFEIKCCGCLVSSHPDHLHQAHRQPHRCQNISLQRWGHLCQDHQWQHHHCGAQVSGHSGWQDHQQQHRFRSVARLIGHSSAQSHLIEKLNVRLPLCDRNHDKDHHHPDDLQAKCHRGSEDHREGSDHSGPPRQECGHHAAERRGQSGDTWNLLAFQETQKWAANGNSVAR